MLRTNALVRLRPRTGSANRLKLAMNREKSARTSAQIGSFEKLSINPAERRVKRLDSL